MAANPLPRPKRTSTKPSAAPSKEAAFYRGGKDRSGDVVELHPKDLCPNPFNRRAMSGVAELAATIQEVGLLQNIAHIPADIWVAHYPETADNITAANVILFGEHRWRAVQTLGWEMIPSVLMDDKVADARLITLIENLRRAQLSPLEEAEHYVALRSSGLSYEQIAQKVGETAKGAISKGTVWKRVQLLALEPEVQGALRNGTLAVSTAEKLQKMSAEDQREAVTLVQGGMRPLEAQAQILARQRQTETEPAEGKPAVSSGNAAPQSRTTAKKEQPKPSADQYEQDRRIAAAARDTACQLLVETTDVGDPANSELLLKAMTGALLAPQQQSAAQQRALVWLRRAERHRLDDQNASSYFNAVQDSGDGELQRLAAFAISLAAAELRTAARRHSWGTRETGYLHLLQEHAQYTPDTAWEKKELAFDTTGETE
ncbi:ParB/RepB/Spo0J family partition protein [Streptomyces drozdowiczii]|uniref:ParB/RepB/Spo0J family partition protein n=1 Tax=Streptomyces drozdowiczii TaxID=202862 RepID=A0ABY6Q1Y9_9ACTN|nr:ParB/RepB/Spo0J family partition protein [Streptomyces drozdowiczii]MCX0247983.1 ParB/RepB/Spo0J family partition protein [Streptomyces drozdowiczii]UZK58244.1 ParB/RepB/Spo0J family partition protein [Streptomyces drozdowiczii]